MKNLILFVILATLVSCGSGEKIKDGFDKFGNQVKDAFTGEDGIDGKDGTSFVSHADKVADFKM